MTLQPFHSNNITRFKGYVYLLNHQDKEFTFFFLSIHTLIIKVLIMKKQEQKLLFLEFKVFIYLFIAIFY